MRTRSADRNHIRFAEEGAFRLSAKHCISVLYPSFLEPKNAIVEQAILSKEMMYG
jgi:hypothetical protein